MCLVDSCYAEIPRLTGAGQGFCDLDADDIDNLRHDQRPPPFCLSKC